MGGYGFYRASGSKLLCATSLIFTGISLYYNIQADVNLRLVGGGGGSIVKTILFSQVALKRMFPELMCGLYLLYAFRQVEREFGTKVYFSFIILSTIVSVVFQVCFLSLFPTYFSTCASGPFGPIFSLLVYYFGHIPGIPLFKAPLSNNNRSNNSLNVSTTFLTNKLYVYANCFVLAQVDGVQSFLPALCGFVAGCVVKRVFGEANNIIPDWVEAICMTHVDPYIRTLSSEEYRAQLTARRGVVNADLRQQQFAGGVGENLFGQPVRVLCASETIL